MKPNLFQFATKELSQDAFLCWFISWSDLRYKAINPKLHNQSKYFISEILKKGNLNLPDDYKITIKMQYQNIDILILIESEEENIVFLIEDKVSSTEHDNQLEKYKGIIENKFKNRKIILTYIKSDLLFKNEINKVKNSFYHLIDIHEFYKLIHNDKIDNAIFNDFQDNLNKKIKGYNIYLPHTEWKDSHWYSFTREVNSNIKNTHFGSYHLGSTWWLVLCRKNFSENQKIDISLEISNRKKLLIKIHSKEGLLDKNIQNNIIKNILPPMEKYNAIKPKNIRGKKTRAILDVSNFIILDDKGIIDFKKTLNFISSIIKHFKNDL